MRLLCAALLAFLALSAARAAEPPPARILVVGTWHFANPGLDLHNMQSDDVLSTLRQKEIHTAALALETFAPNKVFVEWPEAAVAESFAAWRAGQLPLEQQRNEVVQFGFRIALHRKLDRVYGIDMPGEFPMPAVAKWASEHGKDKEFGMLMQRASAMVKASSAQLKTQSIGAVLRAINTPEALAEGQALYLELLRYGAGEAQPGAELNAAWQRRNYLICARLLQNLQAGDRAIVFFGQGHAHALHRCIVEAPGVELVQANAYLPQ